MSTSTPPSLKEELARLRAKLAATLAKPGQDGHALGSEHAAALDVLMSGLFARAAAEAGGELAVALAAVGSYGRGAVALRSDADVRIVVPRGKSEAAARFADALLYPLWDAGFSLGHQVLDAGQAIELANTDLATTTSLLDMRTIAATPPGQALVSELLARAWSGVFDESALDALVERLEGEAQGRHARFGGSVYLLEPDVKSGAGGLRDLDGARWAARARFKVDQRDPWGELVRLGVLVAREAHDIRAAEEFLWRVRNRLHAHAGRRSDRLTFDEQEAIALELDFAPSSGSPAQDRHTAAERFMQDYYLHARVVTRARERLLERARPPRRRGRPHELDLGNGVHLFDGQVTIASTQALHDDPSLAMRVYVACAQKDAPILPFAREAIARATGDPAWCEALRGSRDAAAHFVELACVVHEVRTRSGSMMRELHDVGLLLAMIPEFRPVTGRVHHDVYHVFTVDVHSVAAVDCLRALARGELAQQHPLTSRLAAEIARPRPLFLATLLHDVGKGYPDASGSRKNHSKSGAEICDGILPRLGLSAEETAHARALVLQHLAMYHVATRRDLDDEATIEEFARDLSREALRDLYLLTVADISTTSPTAMTTWKARMLDELYLATDAFLAGKPRDEGMLAEAREAARRGWDGSGAPAFFDDFLSSMPECYLLQNASESIVAHARVALARGASKVHAALVPSRHPDVAELCVVAEDRPGLLARIAAAITAGKLEVLAAQVYSRPMPSGGGEAWDLFWVRDRVDGADGVARAMPRLLRDLADVCGGEVDPLALLEARTGTSAWAERRSPAVTTEVVIDDRASPRYTVIEVFAKDRPGLLHALARVLHEAGLQIVLSKINTEGTRVADVFYVSELDGAKVKPGERVKAIREAIFRAVGA